MKLLLFTEGTILMHKSALGCSQEVRVKQVKEKEESVHQYDDYIPIGKAVEKVQIWKQQGVEIIYLTSCRKLREIKQIENVLHKWKFPQGVLIFRHQGQEYKDVVELVVPDILVEDDCKSIGGTEEMAIYKVKPAIQRRIKLIVVPEFGGIDPLPDKVVLLRKDTVK